MKYEELKIKLVDAFDQLLLELRGYSKIDAENYTSALEMLDILTIYSKENGYIDKDFAMLFIDFFIVNNPSEKYYSHVEIDDLFYKSEEIYSKIKNILIRSIKNIQIKKA